jgi:hypothetical protein
MQCRRFAFWGANGARPEGIPMAVRQSRGVLLMVRQNRDCPVRAGASRPSAACGLRRDKLRTAANSATAS